MNEAPSSAGASAGVLRPTLEGQAAESSRDRNNFDPLRLLFALCVLAGHSFSLAKSGASYAELTVFGRHFSLDIGILVLSGLSGFFAISGYLVSGSYLSTPRVGPYLWKRILRIVPAFLVVALLSILVVGPIGSEDCHAYFRDLDVAAQIRAVASLHVPRDVAHAFPRNHIHQLNAPTWSLPVEFALYLLIALLGITSLLRRRWPVAGLWVALVVLHVCIAWFEPSWADVPRFAQGTLHKCVPLYLVFVGGAMTRLYPVLRRLPMAGAAAFLGVMGHACGMGHLGDFVVAPFIVIWVGEHPFHLPRPRDDLSYGMYLNAWPIQQILVAFFSPAPMILIAWTVALSVPLASLSWRFIERPALRFKDVDVRAWLSASGRDHTSPRS